MHVLSSPDYLLTHTEVCHDTLAGALLGKWRMSTSQHVDVGKAHAVSGQNFALSSGFEVMVLLPMAIGMRPTHGDSGSGIFNPRPSIYTFIHL